MNDDYLWDRSGSDPEVERLEKLLGRYRHDAPLRVTPMRRRKVWLAVAAALVVAIAIGAFALRFQWRSGAPWEIVTVKGKPTIDGKVVGPSDRLAVGQVLRTDGHSTVIVEVARVGELEIAPGSELEIVATSRRRHRIALRSGKIHARVWAPPFVFAVRTPAGLASDLGCAFTLQYGGDAGVLHVTSGWVDFDGDFRSSIVPAGALAELREEHGPGTPYYPDASPEFRNALRALDFDGHPNALERLIAAARPRDAMTLLHLLERSRPSDRAALFDRLATLAPPPPDVTREGIVAGDLGMVHAWRRSLGLTGYKQWWLQWRDAI